MNKLKRIYHIADIHIRNLKRHTEYREVFNRLFNDIKVRGTEDSLIYLAGDLAHAKLEMSPEPLNEINYFLLILILQRFPVHLDIRAPAGRDYWDIAQKSCGKRSLME